MAQKAKPAPAKAAPAEQAVPDSVILALQRELNQQGYYAGPIDGRMGKETADAVKRRDDSLNSKNTVKTSENNLAAEAAKNSPVAQGMRMATEAVPYVGGVAAGTAMGHYAFGEPMAAADVARRGEVNRLAQDASIDPVVKEQRLNKLIRDRGVRNTAQFLAPAGLAGMGYATRNYIAPQFSDPNMKDIVNAFGTGENAAAGTLGIHQLLNTLAPKQGTQIDMVDDARIRSDALRARTPQNALLQSPATSTQAALPAPQAVTPQGAPDELLRHSERLGNAAAAAGGKAGKSKSATYQAIARNLTESNVADVAKALDLPETVGRAGVLQRARELMNTGGRSSILLPLAAAGAAYEMAGPAKAADGTESGSPAIAAAAAGGTAYGANRLIQAIPQVAKTALSAGGEGAAPAMIDSMTDYSPDELAQGRNTLARNLPSALRGGAVEDAYQMAQVPERGDRSDPAMMARDSAAQAQAMPMASAAGLDASAPQAAPQGTPSDDFDAQLAELSALLQQIGQAQAPGPVANARDSMAVAAPPPPPPQRTWQDSQNRLLAR